MLPTEMSAPLRLDLVFDVQRCDTTTVVLLNGPGNHVGTTIACVGIGYQGYVRVKVCEYCGVLAHVIESRESEVGLAEL
jgi:hypothetical protein